MEEAAQCVGADDVLFGLIQVCRFSTRCCRMWPRRKQPLRVSTRRISVTFYNTSSPWSRTRHTLLVGFLTDDGSDNLVIKEKVHPCWHLSAIMPASAFWSEHTGQHQDQLIGAGTQWSVSVVKGCVLCVPQAWRCTRPSWPTCSTWWRRERSPLCSTLPAPPTTRCSSRNTWPTCSKPPSPTCRSESHHIHTISGALNHACAYRGCVCVC